MEHLVAGFWVHVGRKYNTVDFRVARYVSNSPRIAEYRGVEFGPRASISTLWGSARPRTLDSVDFWRRGKIALQAKATWTQKGTLLFHRTTTTDAAVAEMMLKSTLAARTSKVPVTHLDFIIPRGYSFFNTTKTYLIGTQGTILWAYSKYDRSEPKPITKVLVTPMTNRADDNRWFV